MAATRVTQVYTEVLLTSQANIRATQVYLEVLLLGQTNALVTQVYVEVLRAAADVPPAVKPVIVIMS